jgi:hypothetical protein
MKNTEANTTTTETAATTVDQTPKAAPKKASKKAAPKKSAPKAKKPTQAEPKPAKAPKAKAAKPAKEAAGFRSGTKGAKILELISRPKGASLAELMKAANWQAHSVRGFISGALGKKLGIKVESAKRDGDGERVYTLAK